MRCMPRAAARLSGEGSDLQRRDRAQAAPSSFPLGVLDKAVEAVLCDACAALADLEQVEFTPSGEPINLRGAHAEQHGGFLDCA